jgi:hypothetical protein
VVDTGERPETDEAVEAEGAEGAEGAPDVDEVPEGSPDDWERPIERFRRGAVGSALAAGMFGLRDALEGRPERDKTAEVADAPLPRIDHIDLVLDPNHPERSRAIVHLPAREDDPPD